MENLLSVCLVLYSTCLSLFTPALEKAQQNWRRTLARGESCAHCMLSELWPTAPPTGGQWGTEPGLGDSGRCLDSGCGQCEVEEGEEELQLHYVH